MKTFLAFQDSQIAEVKVGDLGLEIRFCLIRVVSPDGNATLGHPNSTPIATIILGQPKYTKLPNRGTLTDGELFGIPGKSLNGLIPIPLQRIGDFELNLCFEDKEYSLRCKSIQLTVDLSAMPQPSLSLH